MDADVYLDNSASTRVHPAVLENQPSHVLRAIGLNPVEARGALRVSLGRDNTESEIDRFLSVLFQILNDMRAISNVGCGGYPDVRE